MTKPNRARISLKVEAEADSLEGKLLEHVKEDPITPAREVALRALKAFYFPWAMEKQLSEAELRSLAQSTVEELQFRIFQIQQRFLAADSPAGAAPAPQSSNNFRGNQSAPQSMAEMRQQIRPADLDDF